LIPKDPVLEALDLLAQLPALFADYSNLRTCPSPQRIAERLQKLSMASNGLDNKFKNWEVRQISSTGNPPFWREKSDILSVSGVPNLRNHINFNECLSFTDLEAAYSHLFSWTGRLLLYATHYLTYMWIQNTANEVIGHFVGGKVAMLGSFDLPPTYDGRECALNIAQSMGYFLKPDAAGITAALIGFPMAVARGYFHYFKGSEDVWFTATLKHLSTKLCIPLDNFLESMACETAHDKLKLYNI
jgi:hypothetical protein